MISLFDAMQDEKVKKAISYYKRVWSNLDEVFLDNAIDIAIEKSIKKHDDSKQEFVSTFTRFLNWEIKRKDNRIKGKKFASIVDTGADFENKPILENTEENDSKSSEVIELMKNSLDEKTYKVIMYRAVQNLSWAEISSIMGINWNSIKTIYDNGIKKIQYLSDIKGIGKCENSTQLVY